MPRVAKWVKGRLDERGNVSELSFNFFEAEGGFASEVGAEQGRAPEAFDMFDDAIRAIEVRAAGRAIGSL